MTPQPSPSPATRFWIGLARALALIALFPGVGLGARAGLEAGAGASHYPAHWMEELPADEPELWLVDGFNVVQVALLGGRDRERWWGSARRAELLERAARLSASGARIEVVFDGDRPAEEQAAPGPREVFADSADAWVVARVKAASDPTRIAVVTSDRRLAGRVRHHGARVVAPSEFLRRCET